MRPVVSIITILYAGLRLFMAFMGLMAFANASQLLSKGTLPIGGPKLFSYRALIGVAFGVLCLVPYGWAAKRQKAFWIMALLLSGVCSVCLWLNLAPITYINTQIADAGNIASFDAAVLSTQRGQVGEWEVYRGNQIVYIVRRLDYVSFETWLNIVMYTAPLLALVLAGICHCGLLSAKKMWRTDRGDADRELM